jgi:hypothetical protein
MPDEIKPKILQPDGMVQVWRWRVTPKTVAFIKIGSAIPLLGIAGWLLQNFLQLRGIVNLRASQIDLALLALCVFGIVCSLTIALPHKRRWRIVGGVFILILTFGTDWLAPKPPDQPTKATTGSSSKETNTASTDTSKPLLASDRPQPLTVSPIKLVFKGQPIGKTSKSQTVIVVNRETAPRIITGIKTTGNFSQTNDCGSELKVGDTCNVEVAFTPTTLGLTHGNLEISCIDPLFSSVNLAATVDFSGSGTANIRSGVLPSKTPNPILKTDKTLSPKSSLELKVSIVRPADPAIVVDNQTDEVADGVTWELVMFRTSDQAFFSYATQKIGYVKAHSKSSRYAMELNTLAQAPGGGGQIANGDSFIGTLAVDCPTCTGTSLMVSFVWGNSGWFYEVPNGNGKLLWPIDRSTGAIDLSKEGVSRFIDTINASIKPEERTPIL